MFKFSIKNVPSGIEGIVADFRDVITRLDNLTEAKEREIDVAHVAIQDATNDITEARGAISRAMKIRKNISELIED